eukprot:141180_1
MVSIMVKSKGFRRSQSPTTSNSEISFDLFKAFNDFQTLSKVPRALEYFNVYMITCLAEENSLFLMYVNRYRTTPVLFMAKAVYDTFIDKEGIQCVNVGNDQFKFITAEIEAYRHPKNLFDSAYLKVCKFIEETHWESFMKSAHARMLARELLKQQETLES